MKKRIAPRSGETRLANEPDTMCQRFIGTLCCFNEDSVFFLLLLHVEFYVFINLQAEDMPPALQVRGKQCRTL